MHIAHMDAQALAASAVQEAMDARARAKVEATKQERMRMRRMAAQNAENPDFAVEDSSDSPKEKSPNDEEEPNEEQEAVDEEQEAAGGTLNAKA